MIGDCHDMKPLPDSVKKLIEAKTFANIATLMHDGSPHVIQRGRRTCRQAGEKISRTGQVSEPTARYETCIVQDRTPPHRASLHGYYASEIYLRRVDQSYS